jgi:taurine dioxygenase
MTSALRVEQLPVGVEVEGIDLGRAVDEAERAALAALFVEHHLLVFHDQHLRGERQVEVAATFGPILPETNGDFGYVSNVVDGAVVPEGALLFHSDFAFTPEPLLGISLHALAVASTGGATVFADAMGVLDRLPPTMRTRLEQLEVLNVYDFGAPTDRRMRLAELSSGSPICRRPFIGVHPVTGAPVVNANEMHTDSIVGLDHDESEKLLSEVFAVLYAPEHLLRLDWRVGDFAIWDNVAIHHGRDEFPTEDARTLQRVCLGTKTALELVPNLPELLAHSRS